MKKILIRVLVAVVILVMVLSPWLLVIDWKRYSPFVFLVWIVSFAYYLWMRKRVQHFIDERNVEDETEDNVNDNNNDDDDNNNDDNNDGKLG